MRYLHLCVLVAFALASLALAGAPDRTGARHLNPTTGPAGSLPGYAAPPTASDPLARAASREYYSLNFVWTLLAGFLVMFMQGGFALVETGMCRAKNAAHTVSMNFLVYGLGMTAFFVCGF